MTGSIPLTEQKQNTKIMLESFEIIKKKLLEYGYQKIQHLPTRKSIAVGREFYVFKSFVFKKTSCLFHSTCFLGLYHAIFRKKNNMLYKLYKACFMNEPFKKEILDGIFSDEELTRFIEQKIVLKNNGNYVFNYRFVPYEGLFLVGKINMEDPEYAHVNYDSVTFIEFLRKMNLASKKRSLEVGCGAGLVSIEIAKISEHADAVDINPHAIKIMDLNTKLNQIKNIETFRSNCYQNVRHKYDLIISDPPFELMPDEDKNILHRYGGILGMEIALDIFKGLSESLTEDGESVIFTNSYIKHDKTDTLVDALEEVFKDTRFELTLYPISYQINADFLPTYKKNNICYSIGYMIHVKRGTKYKLRIVPLGPLNRAKEIFRLVYLYFGAWLTSKKKQSNGKER